MSSNAGRDPVDVRLAFARAVARDDRCFTIDEHNIKLRDMSVAEGARSGEPFVVWLRGEIVVADDDGDGSAGREFAAVVRSLGLEPVVVESGGENRLHVFVRVASPELRARLRDEGKRMGLDMRRSIRPPLAPHKTRRVTPKIIEPAGGLPRALELLVAPVPGATDPKLWRLIRVGDPFGQYPTRYRLTHAITYYARQDGMDFDVLLALLRDERNVGGHRVREEDRNHRRRDGEGWLRISWNRVTPPGSFLRGAKARAAVRSMRVAARSMSWSGTRGSTDLAVYYAHLETAHLTGRTLYEVSQRRLGELANVGHGTARASTKRLEALGLLTVERSHSYTEANAYELVVCKFIPLPRHTTPLDSESELHMDTSVFRWGTSLGKGVARTYEQLHHHGHPASLEQLVDLTTMHRTTVTRHLDRLHDEGLVEKAHDGWNVTPNPDWDAIGERTGAAQAARNQRVRHVADRAQLQQRLSAPDLGHVRRGRVVEPDTCRVDRDLDEVAEAPGLLGVEQQRQKRRAEKLVAVTRKPVNTPMRGPRKVGSGGDLGRAVRNHDEQRTAELDAAYEEAGELRIEKKPRGGAALHIVQTSAKKVEVDKCATKLIVNQNLTGVNGDGSVEPTGP